MGTQSKYRRLEIEYMGQNEKKSELCNRNIRGIRMKNPRTQKENAKHVLEVCTNPWNTKHSSARFFDSIFLSWISITLHGAQIARIKHFHFFRSHNVIRIV